MVIYNEHIPQDISFVRFIPGEEPSYINLKDIALLLWNSWKD